MGLIRLKSRNVFARRARERAARGISMEIQYRNDNRNSLRHRGRFRTRALRAESSDIIRFVPAMKFSWEYETSRFYGAR